MFLDNFAKPDVDSIEGLSPSIAIDQKTTLGISKSTFLRLLTLAPLITILSFII